MHPHLFTLPGGIGIKTYGFCLMVAFVTGTWLARRRAMRVKADPDVVMSVAILAVLFGVGGARALHVVHYWRNFADRANPFLAVINLREGGLEFLGGFVCATIAIVVYLVRRRPVSSNGKERRPLSIRLYLDILAPSVIWGLAITRIGCFFNGCCFGGACVAVGTQDPKHAWAVTFPFASPPFIHQWEERAAAVPAELIRTSKSRLLPTLLHRDELATHGAGGPASGAVRPQPFPSRSAPSQPTSLSELRTLASHARMLPVHPTQLYASISAMLLAGLLSALFYLRKRHGVVIATLFVLYPVSRFVLELVRADNPHDTLGLTISQFAGIAMAVVGGIALLVIFRFLPERSPHAVPFAQGEPPRRKASARRRTRRRRSRR